MSNQTYGLAGLGQQALGDEVRKRLHDAIVTGRLIPGTRLVEMRIASDLGVSRGPVREALRKLEDEGLVVTHPRRGSTVATFSRRDVREIYSFRAALEGLAARWVVENLTSEAERQLIDAYEAIQRAVDDPEELRVKDIEFHRLLIHLSGHRSLSDAWQRLDSRIQFFRYTLRNPYPDASALAHRHDRVMAAICSRDAIGAEAAMREHVQDVEARVLATWIEDGSGRISEEDGHEDNGDEAAPVATRRQD